jgi:malonyl-CoA/methylmalonyl-CoA synthetase
VSENLYTLFESRFPKERGAPLLLFADGSELSYAQAEEGAARYASLLAGLGLAPGDRVAVQVEKSAEALLLYLGCLRAGLAYLPLNSAYQEGEIGYFLENAEPRAVVAQPRSLSNSSSVLEISVPAARIAAPGFQVSQRSHRLSP